MPYNPLLCRVNVPPPARSARGPKLIDRLREARRNGLGVGCESTAHLRAVLR